MINKKVIKISVYGPKPYSMGGHNLSSESCPIRNAIQDIVDDLQDQDKILIGLTGLSLGLEQDFAYICLQNKIPYNVYLSHDTQERSWADLPEELLKKYQDLLDEAENHTIINTGAFSPKKALNRQLRVMKDSDYIIYVSGFLPIKNDKLLALLCEKDTKIIPIPIYA